MDWTTLFRLEKIESIDSLIKVCYENGYRLSELELTKIPFQDHTNYFSKTAKYLQNKSRPKKQEFREELNDDVILVDVTSTRSQPFTTGIQRIVRGFGERQNIIYVYAGNDGFYRVITDPSSYNADKQIIRSWLRIHIYSLLFRLWANMVNSENPLRMHLVSKARPFVPYFKEKFIFYPKNNDMYISPFGKTIVTLEVPVSEVQLENLEILTKYSLSRVRCVLHDLIPLTNPEFVPKDPRHMFTRYLRLLLDCEKVFPISKHVNKQYDYYCKMLEKRNNAYLHEFPYFPNESLIDSAKKTEKIRKVRGLKPQEYLLQVGTITRRKNPDFSLELVEYMRQKRGRKFKLVFAGIKGWDFDQLKVSSEKKPWIRIINDCNDDEIIWLYKNAALVLFPSLAEGWGLPVIEAKYLCGRIIANNLQPMKSNCESVNAVTAEVGDKESWYRELSKLLNQTEQPLIDFLNPNIVKQDWAKWYDRLIAD